MWTKNRFLEWGIDFLTDWIYRLAWLRLSWQIRLQGGTNVDYRVLADELNFDTTARGYAGETDAEALVLLITPSQVVERDIVSAHEVFEAIVAAEWATISAQNKQLVQSILGMGQVNVRGANTRQSLGAAFGPGTTTRANLLNLQSRLVSRAEQLNLGVVTELDVNKARAGLW